MTASIPKNAFVIEIRVSGINSNNIPIRNNLDFMLVNKCININSKIRSKNSIEK